MRFVGPILSCSCRVPTVFHFHFPELCQDFSRSKLGFSRTVVCGKNCFRGIRSKLGFSRTVVCGKNCFRGIEIMPKILSSNLI